MLREQYPEHNFERFVASTLPGCDEHHALLYRIVLAIENCGARTVELYTSPSCKKV